MAPNMAQTVAGSGSSDDGSVVCSAVAITSAVETKDQAVSKRPIRWAVGMLNERGTTDIPGSVLLLCDNSQSNQSQSSQDMSRSESQDSTPSIEKKRTSCGKFVLEPQPSESPNDPLNWALWRRDAALLSLGFYCMVGGGMTPILAAGFKQIAAEFHTTDASVALTTGLYAMGLGLGSVILAPTAILFGKRPVYLTAALVFMLTSVWCALSPNLGSLIAGRIVMGLAVSSVECLPSATIAEIFFLHEKAYRLGIYTLLLLSGKNLVPLVSAAIIQTLGWRWVFWIVCLCVSFAWCLLFLLVHETTYDRAVRAERRARRFSNARNYLSSFAQHNTRHNRLSVSKTDAEISEHKVSPLASEQWNSKDGRVLAGVEGCAAQKSRRLPRHGENAGAQEHSEMEIQPAPIPSFYGEVALGDNRESSKRIPLVSVEVARPERTYADEKSMQLDDVDSHTKEMSEASALDSNSEKCSSEPDTDAESLQEEPVKTFVQQLTFCHGRFKKDSWLRVAARPFILFAYPAIVWSAMVYALSIGWLIVLSESMSSIYENKESYNFDALQTGLIYISPFLAGILGTVVAGSVSDKIVRRLARRNNGVYEPEFRLVMIIPVAVTTTIGLMGFGWSAAERDLWVVPAIFFGLISFGCSLGATTAITFAVDSYRQLAGESLVTLNFSKNIFHGMAFSLFFNRWLEADGSKTTFAILGAIQFTLLLSTIPMYIFGKRARHWVARKDFMAKF